MSCRGSYLCAPQSNPKDADPLRWFLKGPHQLWRPSRWSTAGSQASKSELASAGSATRVSPRSPCCALAPSPAPSPSLSAAPCPSASQPPSPSLCLSPCLDLAPSRAPCLWPCSSLRLSPCPVQPLGPCRPCCCQACASGCERLHQDLPLPSCCPCSIMYNISIM